MKCNVGLSFQAGIVDNLRAFQSQHKMKKAGPEGDAESLLEDL